MRVAIIEKIKSKFILNINIFSGKTINKMQGKEKESHCTGSKGRRSKYLQLPISKRNMEKMPKGTIDVMI